MISPGDTFQSNPSRLRLLERSAAILILLPALWGCGGEVSAVPNPVATIQVSIPEDSVSLGAGETHQFNATVTGSINTAVTWSISGCTGAACGTISETGTYTAPSLVPAKSSVTVTATSKADPTKFDTVTVNQMTVEVSIAPPGNSVVRPGASLNFVATVQYDISSTGVVWALGPSCLSGDCGALSEITPSSVIYTAPPSVPNSATLTLTATSVADNSKVASVTITISISAGRLEGNYAFLFYGYQGIPFKTSTITPVAIAGHFHADSNGNITEGVEDVNLASGVLQTTPLTGTYAVGRDLRGTLVFNTNRGTETYRMTLDGPGKKGRFIKFDNLPKDGPIFGTGYFEQQDSTKFSLASLAGPYALGICGRVETNDLAGVGRFSASTDGTWSGRMDVSTLTGTFQISPKLGLTGAFNAPSSITGRGSGMLALTPAPTGSEGAFHFAYYVISDEKLLLVQTDARSLTMPTLTGEIRRQKGSFAASSLNAPVILSMTGHTWFGPVATAGRMAPDGTGSFSGILDQNAQLSVKGSLILNEVLSGSYAVEADGRSTVNFQTAGGVKFSTIAYLFGQNEGFLMDASTLDFGRFEVALGRIRPQVAGPYSASRIAGAFGTGTGLPRVDWSGENDSGITSFDGVRAATSVVDISDWDGLHHWELSGTYQVTDNGRGTLTFTAPGPYRQFAFWIISPSEMVGISTAEPVVQWPMLLEYSE